jgi:hypothetical protein
MPQHVTQYPTRDEIGEVLAARFWAKVQKSDTCWLWTAAADSQGYGVFNVNRRTLMAHRIAYVLHHGSVGLEHVLHKCDVPLCCNPDHLALGNHTRNMREASERGRLPRRHGAANHMAKLTQEQADELRSLNGSLNKSQLSRRFGVSCAVVRKILSGESYPVGK